MVLLTNKLLIGFLLFNKSVQNYGAVRNQRKVRNHWYRIGDGDHDSDFHSTDGPFRQKDLALVRLRWHVHLLHLHHHFLFSKGT